MPVATATATPYHSSLIPVKFSLALTTITTPKRFSGEVATHDAVLLGGDSRAIKSFQNGILNYVGRKGSSRRPRKLGDADVADGNGNVVKGYTHYIRVTESELRKALAMQCYLDNYEGSVRQEYVRNEDGLITDIKVTNELEMSEAADKMAASIVAELPRLTASKVADKDDEGDGDDE